MQTLTTLNLGDNQEKVDDDSIVNAIQALGAKYLAEALRVNTVREDFLNILLLLVLLLYRH